MSKYIHRYTPWWKRGGGGGSDYDDTALKRRITALENGKQNILVSGDGITILGDTISAVNILNDTRESSTTVWSSSKVKSLFESLQGHVDIVITPTKPAKSSAVEKTMYYVGTSAPYRIWFFVNNDYIDFGSTEISLSNYFTKDEVNDLLALKVDKVAGKSLVLDSDIAQITTNKSDIADLKEEKQDKLTDSTLSELSDSTTVSSVSASSKTSKSFALSKLWEYIRSKISSSTGRGISVSGNVIGHSNSEVTSKTNTNVAGLKYDEYGHVTGKGTEYSVSDDYTSSANNQLFTRKGAYNAYTALKKPDAVTSADVSLTCTGLENSFTGFTKLSARRITADVYYVSWYMKRSVATNANTEVKVSSSGFKVNGKSPAACAISGISVDDTHSIGCTINGLGIMFINPSSYGISANSELRFSGIVYAP